MMISYQSFATFDTPRNVSLVPGRGTTTASQPSPRPVEILDAEPRTITDCPFVGKSAESCTSFAAPIPVQFIKPPTSPSLGREKASDMLVILFVTVLAPALTALESRYCRYVWGQRLKES